MYKLIFLFLLPTAMLFVAGNEKVKTTLSSENSAVRFRPSTLILSQLPRPGDHIGCSLQDSKGNLWFGTSSNGVYRYDGRSFKNFTVKDGLKSNAVSSMLQDKNGNIWFGTFSGLSLFDGKMFKDISDTHFSLIYSMLKDTRGKLWISTNNGIYLYNGIAFTRFLDSQPIMNKNGLELGRVNTMIEDKVGNIWFTTCTEGVCRYDGKSLVNYKPNDEEYFRGLFEDKSGNIWVGGRYKGISRYDGKAFTNILQHGNFDTCIVQSIIQDKSGNIWFGTEAEKQSNFESEGGIWLYNGTSFKNYLNKDGWRYNAVWSVLEDMGGNIWVGTRAGLYRFEGKTFTSFSE